MYCRGSLVSVIPSHILGGDDVVDEIPFDDTTTQDTVALFGYETIIKVLECRSLFASERYSGSLGDRRLPEGT